MSCFQTNECNRELLGYQYCQVDLPSKKYMGVGKLLLISRRGIHLMNRLLRNLQDKNWMFFGQALVFKHLAYLSHFCTL